MRLRVALLVMAVAVQAGCSTTEVRLGTPIACAATEPARLILFAQAVPEAAFVPCIDALPAGWTVKSIGTRSGEAVIVFENDTYDVEVAGTLLADCDPAGVEPTTDGTPTLVSDDGGGHAYVFAGGCFVIAFPPEVADADVAELLTVVSFLSRDQLRSLTGWTL